MWTPPISESAELIKWALNVNHYSEGLQGSGAKIGGTMYVEPKQAVSKLTKQCLG